MKIRYLALSAVPFACFCLVGCGSGGVEAVTAESNSKGASSVASAASSGTAPKSLPRGHRKGRLESPGPLPAPEI